MAIVLSQSTNSWTEAARPQQRARVRVGPILDEPLDLDGRGWCKRREKLAAGPNVAPGPHGGG
eukprot:11171041-Lingulodinium_polyedra.AAC.1